jgi:hypothetical protein
LRQKKARRSSPVRHENKKAGMKPAFRHSLRIDASTSVVKEEANTAARLIPKG